MSCELGEDQRAMVCARDENGCVTEGTRLHWGSSCINYAVEPEGSPKLGIGMRRVPAGRRRGVRGGGSPRFHAQSQRTSHCGRVEHVCGSAVKNVSVLMFHDKASPPLRA
jgi:hypothetical protein